MARLPSDSDPIIADFISLLWRHKKKAITVFLLSNLVAVLIVLFAPRTYTSESQLFVRVGRESITLDPTVTTGQTVMMQKSQESEVNSLLAIMTSRALAEQTVKRLGVDTILERGRQPNIVTGLVNRVQEMIGDMLDTFSTTSTADANNGTDGRADPDYELAVRRVMKRSAVWAPKNSTVITVSAKAGSPRLAQQIAETLVACFMDEHVRLNRTAGSFDFFVDQTRHWGEELAETQEALRARKSEFGIASVEGKRETLQMILRDIELQTLQNERALAFAEEKASELEERILLLEPELVTQTVAGHSNEARDRMREKLYELEIRERDLRQTYSTIHPAVVAIDRQREELEGVLDAQPEGRTQTTRALNPLRQSLELQLETQQAEIAALQAQGKVVRSQFEAGNAELERLHEHEMILVALQRELAIVEQNYRTHAEHLEQARVDSALQSEHISNINLVQEASYVTKPSSPNKKLTVLAGLVFGVLGGVATALLFGTGRGVPTDQPAELWDDELRVTVVTKQNDGKLGAEAQDDLENNGEERSAPSKAR